MKKIFNLLTLFLLINLYTTSVKSLTTSAHLVSNAAFHNNDYETASQYYYNDNAIYININELKKRLFAIKILEGKINTEEITYEDKEIGKLLINNQNPFALIKFQSENFNFENNLKCGEAKIKVIKPKWLKLS